MKRGALAKKIQSFTLWIIFLSLVGLILISFLPWVSIEENDSIKENLYFDFEMMQKSNNEQIFNLASELNFINISFWVMIILGILSLIGTIIHVSGKVTPVAQILLILGSITLIFNILIIVLLIFFIRSFNIDNIKLASFAPLMYYAYIPLIVGFLSLIYTAKYTRVVIPHAISKFKEFKEQKKEEAKKPKKTKPLKKPKRIKKKAKKTKITIQQKPTLDKIPLAPEPNKKRIEMEDWLSDQVENLEKQAIKEKISEEEPPEEQIPTSIEEGEKEEIIQVEEKKSKEPEEEITEPIEKKDEKTAEPFPSTEPKKEEQEEPEEPSPSPAFEDALSTAIEKRHNGTKEEKEAQIEQPSKKEELEKEKFNVRCPQCKHIFTAEKGEGITNIKCPKCGKEGKIQN